MPTITVAHYYYIVESGCPHRRVKSIVTCNSKRWTQEKTAPVLPKEPKRSAGDKGMQGRPEL